MATWLMALRLELLSLLRMREAYTFGVLPAVLVVPVSIAITMVVLSFMGQPTLAIPLEDPNGISLEEALAEDYEVMRVADPGEAVEQGTAETAILSWEAQEPPVDAWLMLEVRGTKAGALLSHLDDALEDLVDEQIVEAGGQAHIDRVVAKTTKTITEIHVSGGDLDARQGLWIAYTILACYLGCFLIPVRTTAERTSGALEALAVTATPVVALYGARLLISTSFFLFVTAIPGIILWLLVGNIESTDLRLGDIIEVSTVVLSFNAAFIVCGLLAGSVRISLYYASYLILFAMPGFFSTLFMEQPWIPLVGFVSDHGIGPQAVRIAATLAMTGLLLFAVHRLAQGERVLPPGEGDE